MFGVDTSLIGIQLLCVIVALAGVACIFAAGWYARKERDEDRRTERRLHRPY